VVLPPNLVGLSLAEPSAALQSASAPHPGPASWTGFLVKPARWLAWAVTGSGALALLTQPVSADAQLALAAAVIIVMAGLWIGASGQLARMAFLTLGSLVILRYVYWRATSTLPSWNEPLSFSIGLVLFAAELYCVIFLAINLIINADPMERKPVDRQPEDALPTVDVFVPSYNEDEDILAMTLSAAKLMDYPKEKLTIWLLDDGGTDQKCNDADPARSASAKVRRASLQGLCAQLGVKYLTRERNEHAKAGNLNSGLKASRAAIIVVFDADHVPFRQFLRETVGHFSEDPKLFLVQTPHVFLNPDPIEKNLATFDRMPSENEMFYSITQRGLDKWNGSFFCGSAALLRRSALEQTGGFSGITITEDCETAFELHAKGWTSLYVDKPLIAGLQPETFASFIGQRSRWCQGMFQIMLLKNPALKRGLLPIQRLAYLSSMTFWLFPLPRLIFMFAPLLHIFFDVKIFVSSIDEALAYTATYIVVNLMLQNYLYGRVRWPWMSELYEYVQGVFLARAIVSVVASPRKPTFNVTAKGQSLDQDHLSKLAPPFLVIFTILALGVGTAGYRYMFEPGVTSLMLVVGLWTAFNLVIAGVALGAVAERKQVDRFPRLPIQRSGVLVVGAQPVDVAIENVSAGGCAIKVCGETAGSVSVKPGSFGKLTVTPLDGYAQAASLRVRVMRSDDGGLLPSCGLAFERLATRDYFALADLMYGDAGAIAGFLGRRRKHMDLFRGTIQFLAWSIQGPVRAVRYSFLAGPVESGAATVPATVTNPSHAVNVVPAAAVIAAEAGLQTALPADPVESASPIPPEAETLPALAAQSEWMRLMLELAVAELRRLESGGRVNACPALQVA
jgi:cellulose synthase (UDP-forming)